MFAKRLAWRQLVAAAITAAGVGLAAAA